MEGGEFSPEHEGNPDNATTRLKDLLKHTRNSIRQAWLVGTLGGGGFTLMTQGIVNKNWGDAVAGALSTATSIGIGSKIEDMFVHKIENIGTTPPTGNTTDGEIKE